MIKKTRKTMELRCLLEELRYREAPQGNGISQKMRTNRSYSNSILRRDFKMTIVVTGMGELQVNLGILRNTIEHKRNNHHMQLISSRSSKNIKTPTAQTSWESKGCPLLKLRQMCTSSMFNHEVLGKVTILVPTKIL